MEELKAEIENRIGLRVGDRQFQKSVRNARKKLCAIISRFGDADGRRNKPGYLRELIYEDIRSYVLTEATMAMALNMHDMEKERPANCRGTHESTPIVACKCR